MIAVGAWLAGFALRLRQRYAEALLARAISLERTRDAEAARAVAEERARIAQELHDVITHTVAVMVVQASAAGAVWDRSPEQARGCAARRRGVRPNRDGRSPRNAGRDASR